MHVAITGAAGDVGRTIAPEFAADRHTLYTHSEHDDLDSELLDATDRRAVVEAVEDVDALVHLAWTTGDTDDWDDSNERNVRMAIHALDAARVGEVDRVVLASSSHVVGMYNRDDPTAFESIRPGPTVTVNPETRLRPDSFYGVAKATVEAASSFYADRYGVEVVVVRIGWLMPPAELRATSSRDDGRHRFARAMWLSPADCRALFRRAVEAPVDRSPVVANGISRNGDRFLSLTETMQRLGYRPQDDASEELD